LDKNNRFSIILFILNIYFFIASLLLVYCVNKKIYNKITFNTGKLI